MSLYQKLFGMNLMAPAGAEEFASGGGDRGDTLAPDNTADEQAEKPADAPQDEGTAEEGSAEEGAAEEETPRTPDGKFAKKEKAPEVAMIPKSRFDDAVNKQRERAEIAERQLAEAMRQQGQIQRNLDVEAAEKQVADLRAQERKALVEGDEAKADALSVAADRLNRQIAIAQASDMTAAAKEEAVEKMRLDLAIESIEENYPMLDDKSDEFDQDLTDDVLDKQRGYMERERLSASKALMKAVKYVMSRQAPAQKEEAPSGLARAAEGVNRKAAAVGKNVDAARRQPASSKELGVDSDKHGQTAQTPDASAMTYDEFVALPESTKAKMRGDFV